MGPVYGILAMEAGVNLMTAAVPQCQYLQQPLRWLLPGTARRLACYRDGRLIW
jgi:hypothetical protein